MSDISAMSIVTKKKVKLSNVHNRIYQIIKSVFEQ